MSRLLPLIVCPFLLWCQGVAAQEAAAPKSQAETKQTTLPTVAPSSPVPSQIHQTKPDLYYLPNKHGNLQAVPGFRFEDFEDLYRIKQGFQHHGEAPRYSLDAISASGSAKQNVAELTIDFDIVVRIDGWVGVPLRLDQAILHAEAKYEGPGVQSLHCEPDGTGYVSWIRGKRGDKHHLTLNVLVPLTGVEEERQLRLSTPRATISELKLTVPFPNAIGTVTEGATLTTLSPSDKKITTFTALGLGGDFELTWRTSDGYPTEAPTVLESIGAIHSKIDDRNVSTKAILTVRSYGAPFDRFQVRLPKKAKLVTGQTTGYSLVPMTGKESKSNKEHQIVEVRFPKKTQGPVEVHLTTTQSHEAGKSTDWIQLTGFEVIGAARQWGHIAVEMTADWHVLWGPRRSVRQVDELPIALQGKERAIGFEYSSQPCSLMVRVVPRKTRVSVEPEYVVLVDAKQVRLIAKLKYQVRGAKAYALDVDLGDWELDTVGPDNLVTSDAVSVNKSGVLSIPLAQPSTGQIELELQAYRIIPTGQKKLTISLPNPHTNSLRPAAVVILAADNVELTPDVKATTGLIRQQVAPQMKLPLRQQDPLFYRCETTRATFASSFSIHKQTITVNVETHIGLKRQLGKVRQKLSYTIAYEPADSLIVDVPQKLAELALLEFELDGQTLSPIVLADQDNTGQSVKMQIPLPSPRIGQCELIVRYPLDMHDLLPKTSVVRTIPLVMPDGGELLKNRLYVSASPVLKVHPRSGVWKVPEGNTTQQKDSYHLQLFAVERTPEVNLTLRLEDRDALGSTIASHVWVQTWLTQNARQDRAVFRFSSDQKDIELVVPTGVELEKVELLLDGKQVEQQVTPEGHLVIPLPAGANNSEHCLELQYNFTDPRFGRGLLSMEIPRLSRGTWVRRMYWQLVLPQNEHLVTTPSGFTHEFQWGWNGLFWGRKGLLEQRELESWVGVPHRTMVPETTNRYLFGSFGPVQRCELRSIDRSWIVLVSSGVALIAGLLLIYVPVTRHPATLLTTAVGLTVIGLLYPEPTLLVLQAACLGLGLALLAGLLERTMSKRRRASTVMLMGSPSSAVEKGSTQTQYRAAAFDRHASTDTAPASPPISASDSNS